MSTVVSFPGISKAPITPDQALEKAIGQFERVLIVGVDAEGRQAIISSETDLIIGMFDLDRAKAWMLREVMDD